MTNALIGFDGEQAIVCLAAVRPDGRDEAGYEKMTGKGIVTLNGNRTCHRAPGQRSYHYARGCPRGAWGSSGPGGPLARIDSRR
jgi:hypothetical protein